MATAKKTPTKETTHSSLKELVNNIKRKAFVKRVVTLNSNDKRDADTTTTAYLTCENQYFSKARIVPLGRAVEIEQCLVDCAKEATILTHVPVLGKNGKPTGNMQPKIVKKYNVQMEDEG